MPSCKTQVSPSPVTILAVSNLISTNLYTILPGKCQEFHGISPMYSDSFMIMSLYTTRDYVPPDFCGILSLMIFYYEEITL